MTRDEPARIANPESPDQRHGLLLRIVSALALGSLAVGAIVAGGWAHAVFWCIAAIGIFLEWSGVVGAKSQVARLAGVAVLIVAGALCGAGYVFPAFVVSILGLMGISAATAATLRLWGMLGLAYAAPVLLGPIVLRGDPQYGIAALVFLCAIVWATDTLAYFAGRLLGGPKLAPALSPKKTWSGAVGGIIGGTSAGAATFAYFGLSNSLATVCLALLLSLVSQIGDLLESAFKRKFGVKDSSRVIPGHGGLMDRLDGFLVAAAVAALIGITRGGTDHAAAGLLIW